MHGRTAICKSQLEPIIENPGNTWGAEQAFGHWFADGLYRALVCHPHNIACGKIFPKSLKNMVGTYTCQLFFSKMREVFRLHRIWISEDLPTAWGDCRRFRKTCVDGQRFPTTSEDFPTTSDYNRRCRKIFDDFKTGPATISKRFLTNLEYY